MKMKERINWTLEKSTIKKIKAIQEEISKKSGRKQSTSTTVDYIVEHIKDPIERLNEENKVLALRINANQERIKELKRGA